ncbi:rubredoxin-like domain-containing protein [Zhaonella formicivorans]|uniref:rubredoxin-like domain-containing protein n=1 Tax=Zhaonella formicivorans TaxID=2528593 RepID=UPI0010DC76CA|nr:rubredoxin [Zhaonella formicivorans]
MMWRCGVCGYVHDGDSPPEKCPKCGAPKEKFAQLEQTDVEKTARSRFSNDLHMQLSAKLDKIIEIATAGIDDNLDPGCLTVFKRAKEQALILKQMVKAEIQTHISKGKWN